MSEEPMPRTTESYQDYVAQQLRDGDRRMDKLAEEVAALKLSVADTRGLLAANSESTARVEKNTAEMLVVFESWRGAMRALEMIGRLAKPLGYIAALLASIAATWAALKVGPPR